MLAVKRHRALETLAKDIRSDGVNIDVNDIERIIDIYERIIITSGDQGCEWILSSYSMYLYSLYIQRGYDRGDINAEWSELCKLARFHADGGGVGLIDSN